MEALSDEQLVDRYRAQSHSPQSESFLNQLVKRHQTRVAAWSYRMTGDVDRASELAHQIFLEAFQSLDAFPADSRFSIWLYTIARNHWRDVEGIAPAADQARKLVRESLDETETRVMTLHYVHELPLDAVTRLFGLTNQRGAKAHIVSAKRKLARALARIQRGQQ